jgi:gliding motility-associated-like protein
VKNTLQILCLILLSSASFGQLLNPGFENYVGLPDNTGQFSKCIGWSNAGSNLASPDYFHYSASASADLPTTPLAEVNAHEGNAIMGFCATGTPGTNFREYISTEFVEPLEVGKEYLLVFRITNGQKTSVSTSGLATSNLSVLFSTFQPTQSGTGVIIANPQFRIDSTLYATNWLQVQYRFVANQAFTNMTIGVFRQDNSITIVDRVPGNSQYSYYFLDNFFLKEVPSNFDPEQPGPIRDDVTIDKPRQEPNIELKPFYVPNSFTPNGDGNNDEFIPIAGSIDKWEMCVYSRWGQKVFFTADPSLGWDGAVDAKPGAPGTYVYEISYNVFDDEQGWIKKTEQGTLQLIR